MRAFLVGTIALFCLNAEALTVNRLNGSAGVTYIDFSLSGAVLPLELARTYNSITATSESKGWLGAFGWGWTAPFETTLTTTPDRNVLLRDGANGNTVLFRPEQEDPKAMAAFMAEIKQRYFEREKGRPFTKEELAKVSLPSRMTRQLRSEPDFRAEIASKYGIQTEIPPGQVLFSSEFGYQTVFQKGGQWIRNREGMIQVFDGDGRLTKQIDKNGFYFTFTYSPTQKYQLDQISDANRSMSLKFKWRGDRITEVVDNRGNKATYTYDGANNLLKVVDSNRQTFNYLYTNKKYPHLLTKIEYANEAAAGKIPYREIRYDDNALVVYHREKDGSDTNYTYGKIARDPENNFWTKAVHAENGKKEETYDEFLIKSRPDGTKYLHRQEHRQPSGNTITVFTPCCGKPLEVTQNGITTLYKYYNNGLLKERVGPKEDVKIEYDPRWKKVSKVSQNGVVSDYTYDTRGNLVRASNTRKEKVSLKYDRFGRILEMIDATGTTIAFKYGDLGKPVLISQTGVGSIKIAYDGQGHIRNAETVAEAKNRRPSKSDSKEVVRRVMKGFQLLLDIIRPAGIGMNLG